MLSGAAGAERRPLPAGCLGRGATARALPVPQRSGLGSAGSPRAPGGRSSGPGSRRRIRPGPRPRRRRHGDGPAPAGSARAARTGSRYRFRGHRRRHGGRHAGECGAVAPRRWRRGGSAGARLLFPLSLRSLVPFAGLGPAPVAGRGRGSRSRGGKAAPALPAGAACREAAPAPCPDRRGEGRDAPLSVCFQR